MVVWKIICEGRGHRHRGAEHGHRRRHRRLLLHQRQERPLERQPRRMGQCRQQSLPLAAHKRRHAHHDPRGHGRRRDAHVPHLWRPRLKHGADALQGQGVDCHRRIRHHHQHLAHKDLPLPLVGRQRPGPARRLVREVSEGGLFRQHVLSRHRQ